MVNPPLPTILYFRESLAQRKKGVTAENEDDIEGAGDTSALEAEDRAKAQLQAFDPASRTTGWSLLCTACLTPESYCVISV